MFGALIIISSWPYAFFVMAPLNNQILSLRGHDVAAAKALVRQCGKAGALIVVAAVSRAAALMPLALIDPARADGAGAAAGRLEPASFAASCAAAIILAVALGLLTVGAGRAIDAALAGAFGAAAMTAFASRQIGGQTGDVAGAAQQWAEIAGWCGLLMGRFAA